MSETKMKKVDFEKDHLLFEKARNSNEYKKLISLVKKCKKVFILGNGGMMDVSSHAAADLSRLVPNKAFYCFNNAGFLTSNANDFGFNKSFTKWLQSTVEGIEEPKTTLLLGLSCSGNSENIMQAFDWALNSMPGTPFNSFLISGVKSVKKPKSVGELVLGTKYFHTTEILVMKLVYDIVYKLGHHCPDIAGEIERKSRPTIVISNKINEPILYRARKR
jgi:phosphoheptose isomerase